MMLKTFDSNLYMKPNLSKNQLRCWTSVRENKKALIKALIKYLYLRIYKKKILNTDTVFAGVLKNICVLARNMNLSKNITW